MTARRLVLVRHGQTEWNLTGRFQGQADVPLDAAGLAQAEALAPVMAKFDPVAVVTSPLQRAKRTAEIIGAVADVPVTEDPRLQEIHVGTWVGLTTDEVDELEPRFYEALRHGQDFRRSPTGETAVEAGDRVAAALREAAERAPAGATVICVGHGLGLRMGIYSLIGWEYPHSLVMSGLWNCSWSVMQPREGLWRLQSYNCTIPD